MLKRFRSASHVPSGTSGAILPCGRKCSGDPWYTETHARITSGCQSWLDRLEKWEWQWKSLKIWKYRVYLTRPRIEITAPNRYSRISFSTKHPKGVYWHFWQWCACLWWNLGKREDEWSGTMTLWKRGPIHCESSIMGLFNFNQKMAGNTKVIKWSLKGSWKLTTE